MIRRSWSSCGSFKQNGFLTAYLTIYKMFFFWSLLFNCCGHTTNKPGFILRDDEHLCYRWTTQSRNATIQGYQQNTLNMDAIERRGWCPVLSVPFVTIVDWTVGVLYVTERTTTATATATATTKTWILVPSFQLDILADGQTMTMMTMILLSVFIYSVMPLGTICDEQYCSEHQQSWYYWLWKTNIAVLWHGALCN